MKTLLIPFFVLALIGCSQEKAGVGSYAAAGAYIEALQHSEVPQTDQQTAEFVGHVLATEMQGIGTHAAVGAFQSALDAVEK